VSTVNSKEPQPSNNGIENQHANSPIMLATLNFKNLHPFPLKIKIPPNGVSFNGQHAHPLSNIKGFVSHQVLNQSTSRRIFQ
jgi:hypothetical protein